MLCPGVARHKITAGGRELWQSERDSKIYWFQNQAAMAAWPVTKERVAAVLSAFAEDQSDLQAGLLAECVCNQRPRLQPGTGRAVACAAAPWRGLRADGGARRVVKSGWDLTGRGRRTR